MEAKVEVEAEAEAEAEAEVEAGDRGRGKTIKGMTAIMTEKTRRQRSRSRQCRYSAAHSTRYLYATVFVVICFSRLNIDVQ